MTPLLFCLFIFVANYCFLNMMVAFASESFQEINYDDYEKINDDFFEQENEPEKMGMEEVCDFLINNIKMNQVQYDKIDNLKQILQF